MKDTRLIKNISKQISNICFSIISYADAMEECKDRRPELYSRYEEMLIDEISHMQMLTLDITEVVTEGENLEAPENPEVPEDPETVLVMADSADGGVFSQGELTSVTGEKKVKKPGGDAT